MKEKIILIIMILASISIFSEEIHITDIECMDANLEPLTLTLSYESDIDSFGIYENIYGMTIANFFDQKQRDILIRALDKAEEWKNTAIENDIREFNKEIFPEEEKALQTLYNSGDGWWPDSLFINYHFLVLDNAGILKYLFLLQYRTVDDLNNGTFGRSYVFNAGEETSLLEGFIVPEAIESYKAEILKNIETDSLFE